MDLSNARKLRPMLAAIDIRFLDYLVIGKTVQSLAEKGMI
jgi:DNA repair protein RadC